MFFNRDPSFQLPGLLDLYSAAGLYVLAPRMKSYRNIFAIQKTSSVTHHKRKY
jgi:hypothetical protein